MSLPIWNHLCQQQPTLVAAFTECHAKRVHDCTIQLHQSLDSILSTLNRRAMALAKLANFESALRDSNVIQQLSPSSALGYLCESTIYSEQGKQRDVINTCSKALTMVDTKDPDYSTLQQAKATAERHANIRIDFVSQLPVEVVITILVPMFMDYYVSSLKLSPYLNVSHLWRERIIWAPDGLRFTVEDENEDHHLQVVTFARHTKVLHIATYLQGTWLSDLFLDNDFSSLQEVFIGGFDAEGVSDFISALESISNTLTDLTLLLCRGNELRVTDIVSACPNLESLKVHQPRDADISSLPMTTWPKMKNLSIIMAANYISLDHVLAVSKRFPSLKNLSLSICTDLQPALAVPQHFPAMRKLDCFIFEGVEMTISDDEEYEYEYAGQQAINHLRIKSWPSDRYTTHDLRTLLCKYQGTVVELEWAMEYHYNMPEHLWSIQYPCLKKLTLCSSGWWIARNAPLLEELEFRVDIDNPANKMLATIPPNLKRLYIMLSRLPITDHPAVAHYFHRLAQQTQLTHLYVSLGNLKHDYESIIEALCHLHHHLENLIISFHDHSEATDMEGHIVTIVKRCSKLKCLQIATRNAPSTHTLIAISQLEHLQQLAFSIRGADQQEGFWQAVESFTKPKLIKVFPQDPIHDLEITRLAQHRPDMRIMVQEDLELFY